MRHLAEGYKGTKKIKIGGMLGEGAGDLTYDDGGHKSYVSWRSISLRDDNWDLEADAKSEAC